MTKQELIDLITGLIPSDQPNAVSAGDVRESLLAIINESILSNSIVQIEGTSEVDVMSQKAVSDQLDNKANSSDLSSVATSGSYNDLTDKPAIPSIDGLVTDSQLTTELEDYYTKTEVDTELSSKANSSDLSSVATSGSYNDLTDKPVIPSNTSDLTNDSDFATNSSVNQKIADLIGGAPETLDTLKELADAISEEGDAIDTLNEAIGLKLSKTEAQSLYVALVGYIAFTQAEKDKLTGIEANAEVNVQSNWNEADETSDSFIQNKPIIPSIDGLVTDSQLTTELEDYYTKTEVDTELSSKANSSDLSSVATSGSYNDLTDKPAIPSIDGLVTESQLTTGLSTKQNVLVSGTSIKTVNDQSLLGSGNITTVTTEETSMTVNKIIL